MAYPLWRNADKPMYTCSNCGQSLSRKESAVGVYWGCDNCGGYAVSMAILRKAVRREYVTEAWAAALVAQGTRGRNCPTCSHPMTEVPVTVGEQTLKLDVCKLCQFFWFDPTEFESLPPAPPLPPSPESELPLEARQAIALNEVRLIAEKARAEDPSDRKSVV